MEKNRTLRMAVVAIVFLGLVGLACGPTGGGNAPNIVISSPASGTSTATGQEVQVTSTASASAGIARVELSVNGQVLRSDTPPSGNPTEFSIVQSWMPTIAGDVTLAIVAYDVNGTASEPAAIILHVGGAAAETTPVPATPMPDVTGAAGCTLNASWVADVTVPDNTQFTPGSAFIKTWRIRNSGTCDWSAGFNLVFVGGDQMGGEATVAVSPTAAGSTADLSIHMTAPPSPGTYRGNWRMQSDEGLAFGSQVYVQIVVPAPATNTPTRTNTPPPTNTPTPTPTIDLSGIGTVVAIDPGILALLPFTEQVVAQVSIAAGDDGAATAVCPNTSVAVGGGFATTGNDMVLYTHFLEGNGWLAAAQNYAGSSQGVNAYAVCLYNSFGAVSQVYSQATVAAGDAGSATVACPAGSVVTGGGYASDPDTMWVYNSSMNGNGWLAAGRNTSGEAQGINVYAVCLAGAAGTTAQVVEQTSIAGNDSGGAEATCPSGSIVTGGGFALGDNLVVYNTSIDDWTGNWIAYASNTAGGSQLINAYAVCLSFP